MYLIKFYDSINRKGVQYTNIRSLQFTRSRSKSGKANFSLDQSPQTRSINAGWIVEIYRDGKKIFWGQVIKKQNKKGKVKIFAHDAIGILNSRLLKQRPSVNQEASLEVIEKLDGLEILKGFKLKAGDFVKPSSTSRFWHWQSNKFGDFIKDIGEQVNNISGDPQPFFYWVTPNLDVIFEEEGARGYLQDLNFASLTVDEDITSTYNVITVEGLPILKLPYDGDFWTEYLDTNHWEIGGFSISSKTEIKYGDDIAGSLNWNSTNNIRGDYDGANSNTSNTSNHLEVWMLPFDGDTLGGDPTNEENIIISAKAYGSGFGLIAYLSRDTYSGGDYCAGHTLTSSMTGSLVEYSTTCTHPQGSPTTQAEIASGPNSYKIKIKIDMGLGSSSQTKNPSSASGWSNASYVIGNDSNYARIGYQENMAPLIATMSNFTLFDFSSFTNYKFTIEGYRGDFGMEGVWYGYVSKNGGSSYCSGHSFLMATYVSSTTITCSHSNAPNTEGELEGSNIKIKIIPTGTDDLYADNFLYIDYITHKVTYVTTSGGTGYADGVKYSITFDSADDKTDSIFNFDNTERNYQSRSLKNQSQRTAIESFTEHNVVTTKNIAGTETEGNYKNLENVSACYIDYRYKDAGAGIIDSLDDAIVIFTDISGETRTWVFADITDPGEEIWVTQELLDMSSGGVDSSGTFNIKQVTKHSIILKFTVTDTTDSEINVWIDQYYFKMSPYEYTAEDSDSIRRYGRLEKEYIMRNFYSNADCEELADTLIANWKDPKLTINCSLSSFMDIEPNTLIQIKFDDQVYIKPLSSITYYLNSDGAESAQLTLGDFVKTDLEKLMQKLSEINKNNNLIISPYQLA